MLRQFLTVTITSTLLLLIVVSAIRAAEQGRVSKSPFEAKALKNIQLGDSFERKVTVYLPPGIIHMLDQIFAAESSRLTVTDELVYELPRYLL